MDILCSDTDKQASRKISGGWKHRWFYKDVRLIFYMALVKLGDIGDHRHHLPVLLSISDILHSGYDKGNIQDHILEQSQMTLMSTTRTTKNKELDKMKLFRLIPLMDRI